MAVKKRNKCISLWLNEKNYVILQPNKDLKFNA